MIRSSGASPMAIGTRNGFGQWNRDVVGIPVKRERPNSRQGIPRGPVGRDSGRDRRLGQCNAGGEWRNLSGSSACSACSIAQQWNTRLFLWEFYVETRLNATHHSAPSTREKGPIRRPRPYRSCQLGDSIHRLRMTTHVNDSKSSSSGLVPESKRLGMEWPVNMLTLGRWSLGGSTTAKALPAATARD